MMNTKLTTLAALKTYYEIKDTDTIAIFANIVIKVIETEVKSISTIQTDINKQFSLEIPFDPL